MQGDFFWGLLYVLLFGVNHYIPKLLKNYKAPGAGGGSEGGGGSAGGGGSEGGGGE